MAKRLDFSLDFSLCKNLVKNLVVWTPFIQLYSIHLPYIVFLLLVKKMMHSVVILFDRFTDFCLVCACLLLRFPESRHLR